MKTIFLKSIHCITGKNHSSSLTMLQFKEVTLEFFGKKGKTPLKPEKLILAVLVHWTAKYFYYLPNLSNFAPMKGL